MAVPLTASGDKYKEKEKGKGDIARKGDIANSPGGLEKGTLLIHPVVWVGWKANCLSIVVDEYDAAKRSLMLRRLHLPRPEPGNARATVFHGREDYDAFLEVMTEAAIRAPMRILAYCLMPNHFHLAVWPREDGELSRWMHWLMTKARRGESPSRNWCQFIF